MRTDERFLTQVVLKEIACPSENNCPKASRCVADDEGSYQEAGVGWMRAVHEDYAEMLTCVTKTVLSFYRKLFEYKLKLLDRVAFEYEFKRCIIAPDETRLKLLTAGAEYCKLHLCTSYGELVRNAEDKVKQFVTFVGPRIPKE
jgi:hypothetical protein